MRLKLPRLKFGPRRLSTMVSALILTAGAVLLVVSAVFAAGFPVDHVSLNDGGIWVTSDADHLFGRLNKPAGQLDAAFYPPHGAQDTASLDVVQQGAAVAAWDKGSGVLYPVDASRGVPAGDDGPPISATDQVQLAGGTLAVLNPASGAVWAQRVDPTTGITSLASVDPSTKPLATVGVKGTPANAALAVGVDGTVYAVSSSGRIATISVSPNGGLGAAVYSQLGHGVEAVTATAVGDRLVVVDPDTGTVVIPGGPTASLGASAGRVSATAAVVPQMPGPAEGDVIIATSTALVSVDLSSGATHVLTTSRSGTPAAPVRLDNCIHAAWGGAAGGYVRSCNGSPAAAVALAGNLQLAEPVFRVNRDAIVLNDVANGAVWDLSDQQRVDDWSSVKPPPVNVNKGTKNETNPAQDGHPLPPKPIDDVLGARPGRTTLLHVLDNDSDPSGAILAIIGVTTPDNAKAHLSIAPDGQTVAITIPDGISAPVHFKYTVSDGKLTNTANVTVDIRGPGDNRAPAPLSGYRPRTWTVPVGGHLEIPVVPFWRDFDGDPIGLVDATVPAGQVTTTTDGSLDYTAPATGGTQTITYDVTDGIAAPVRGKVTINVQPPAATTAVAPVTQPDMARGEVGQPITISPLDNDLPGSDPTDPSAKLQLAGDLASPAGTTVTTDLATGTVVVTAAREGTYTLNYKAAFGSAPFASGSIRVDVVQDPTSAVPPVAMPDSAVLHGQQAATVDVLANDFDPAGGILVVSHAAPADPTANLQVAIVNGRWLRIGATDSSLSATPQVVDYTITDGLTSPVTGEVSVTELPAAASTAPVTEDDYATVRAGDEVTVPVLDNDTNPAGAPMSLVPNVQGAPAPGQLSVSAATGGAGVGTAYVTGNAVRFVAPTTVAAAREVVVDYVATDASGNRSDGALHVDIEPAPSATFADRPPVPQPVEARAVAGQTITVQIPTTGVDPDGDTVTVAGIDGAPTLGRILRFNATSLTYQAYPTSAGTDTFTYVVTDRYGQRGEAAVRVGVVAPDLPQPPVAVDDDVSTAPGARVHVNVLANDLVAPGDSVTVQPLTAADASLAGFLDVGSASVAQGYIDAVAPPANGVPLVIRYRITDGVNPPSEATLTIRSDNGADMPPVVSDAYPSVNTATKSVTVDVTRYAQDPDGGDDVKVDQVFDPTAQSTASTITLAARSAPRTVSYEVVDSGGAKAIGLIHVPAFGAGFPFVTPGTSIAVPTNGSRTVDLSSVITDPGGKPIRLTTTDRMDTSPSTSLKVTNKGESSITLTAGNYRGPASVTVEVTDGTSLTDPNGHVADLTIPVQVGTAVPVLRCPTDPLTAVEGGATVTIDVTSVCHVWAADDSTLAGLHYTASWQGAAPSDVQLTGSGTHTLTLTAGSAAVPGSTGTLVIGVANSDATTSTLSVSVRAARPPTVPDVRRTVNAGRTVSINLGALVNSELRNPVISIVDVVQTSGPKAVFHKSAATLSVTPDAKVHGVMTFDVSVTDVADLTRTDRIVHGTVTLNVLGAPDAPGTPSTGRTTLSKSVQLSWPSPANNGAPISSFEVSYSGGTQTCAASPCLITGLTNGTSYTFKVRARNIVGWGGYSPPSPSATPNSVPGAVPSLAVSDPQDGSLKISWGSPPNQGTVVEHYEVTWSGGGTAQPSGLGTTVTGLDNDTVYTFRVVAVNQLGPGPAATVTGQSAGAPATPPKPTVSPLDSADSNTKAVTISWSAIDPNGPGPTTYTLVRTGGSGTKTVCSAVTSTSCDDDGIANDGTVYSYALTAANADAAQDASAHTSKQGPAQQMEASATPDPVTGLSAAATGTSGQATINFNAPASHGKSSTIKCTANGNSCGTWTFPTGGQSGVTETINGLSNGSSTTISLQDCNGSTGIQGSGSACDATVSTSVTTYGPLQNAKVTASASGTTVSFTVSVDPNGKAANVTVTHNGATNTFTTGTGAWSWSGSDNVGYSTTDNIKITASSSGRTTVSATGSATTGAPPPPPATAAVSKGSPCGGGGGPACPNGSCTNSSCAMIHLHTTGFQGSYTCIFTTTYSAGGPGFNPETYSSNVNQDSQAWLGAPGYKLSVTCSNSSQSASGSMTWY